MKLFALVAAAAAALLPLASPLPGQQADKPVEAPVPGGENWLTGYVELGFRARTDVGGSLSTYRSIVDIGSGPKLLGADFTIADPKHRLFDRIGVRALDWGDDPYATLHVDVRKSGLYRFDADYRSLAYFNNLPSFADPQLSRGIALNEQSFDTRRHLGSYSLDLLPDKRFSPYFSFERNADSGRGVSSFVDGAANEYAVPSTSQDLTNLYRGGLRIELPKARITLEEGGITYREDQNVYVAAGGKNFGDTTAPYLGQSLYLSSLLQAYGIRGSSTYSKGLVSAAPVSWLDLSGQFVFSQSNNSLHYQQNDTGNFAVLGQALLVTSEQYLISSAAKLPHTTAGLGAEIRPVSRVRILESWLTDRLHNAGSGANLNAAQPLPALLASTLASNYNQQESDVIFDVTRHLTLRGGYRFVWGDASDLVLPQAGLLTVQNGRLRRNVTLAGAAYRAGQKLTIRGDLEVANSSGAYFRTSLYNYRKARAQARYQLLPTLNIAVDAHFLNNTNPLAGDRYDYSVTQEALSVQWLPAGAKALSFLGTYERSAIHSDISYLVPQLLTAASSIYRENAHSLTALFSANLPLKGAKISAGGSALTSSGSRPTTYYQPVAKLSVPLGRHAACFAEWRYYGFGETFYLYESFRTHLFTTGLRFTR